MKMEQRDYGLAEAEEDLRRALHILTCSALTHVQGEEWVLLVGLVGEAALVIDRAQEHDLSVLRPLLETVIAEFRDGTNDFRNRDFLRSTRGARRRYRKVFPFP
jgi:hypothetical protein